LERAQLGEYPLVRQFFDPGLEFQAHDVLSTTLAVSVPTVTISQLKPAARSSEYNPAACCTCEAVKQ
jgi:hypothetical protein